MEALRSAAAVLKSESASAGRAKQHFSTVRFLGAACFSLSEHSAKYRGDSHMCLDISDLSMLGLWVG